jgi:hypothetical protein
VQSSEAKVGPYALQDFTLFHVLRYGFRPSKIAFLAWRAWHAPNLGGGLRAFLPINGSATSSRRSRTGFRCSCGDSSR